MYSWHSILFGRRSWSNGRQARTYTNAGSSFDPDTWQLPFLVKTWPTNERMWMSKKFKGTCQGFGTLRRIDCDYSESVTKTFARVEILSLVEETTTWHPLPWAEKLVDRSQDSLTAALLQARLHLTVITALTTSRHLKRVFSNHPLEKTPSPHCLLAV